MDQASLWKFITNNRLNNGKVTSVGLCRLLAKYGQKEFDLHFHSNRLKEEIALIQKYDFESSDIENELSRFDDPVFMAGKIESLLLEDYAYNKKRRHNQYKPTKVLLFRSFVNALIRSLQINQGLVYLKTGSAFKLATNIDKIFSKRIDPLMRGDLKPKKIVSEESAIVAKSKAVIAKYKPQLDDLYAIGRTRSYKYAEGDVIDLKTMLLLLREFGIFKYDSLEDQLASWMIIERVNDPEESVFRLITKLIQKGKPDERIDNRIRPIILPKLHGELTFDEFQEMFLIFFCKAKDISPKVTTFANKLNNNLKTAFENQRQILSNIKDKKKRPARTFPKSKKDQE